MSKGNINLKELSDVKLRDDGEQVQMTFVGKNNQNVTVTMSLAQLQDVERKIIEGAYAARFNRGLHSDTPRNFTPLRDVILADGLQLEIAPEGNLNFLIQSHDKRTVQVTLRADHSQMLRQILGGQGEQFHVG